MIVCPKCGVELDDNVNFCSLCGEPVTGKGEDTPAHLKPGNLEGDDKLDANYEKLTEPQKRKIAWHVSWIILLSGMVISLIIDLAYNRSVTWSKYPVIVSLVIFINISIGLFLYKKLALSLFLSFLSIAGLLVILDIFAGRTGWGIGLGIPLLMVSFITLFLLVNLVKKTKQKGLNIIAYIIIAIGILSACTNGIIELYIRNSFYFSWGLIVLASTTLTALLLLYIHYRLKKVTDLKRFFHI